MPGKGGENRFGVCALAGGKLACFCIFFVTSTPEAGAFRKQSLGPERGLNLASDRDEHLGRSRTNQLRPESPAQSFESEAHHGEARQAGRRQRRADELIHKENQSIARILNSSVPVIAGHIATAFSSGHSAQSLKPRLHKAHHVADPANKHRQSIAQSQNTSMRVASGPSAFLSVASVLKTFKVTCQTRRYRWT